MMVLLHVGWQICANACFGGNGMERSLLDGRQCMDRATDVMKSTLGSAQASGLFREVIAAISIGVSA